MTYAEVSEIIDSIGIPTAYYQFPEKSGQEPPFICFYYDSDADLQADNSNYQTIRNLTIELYADAKDFELEETVEAVLNTNEFVYTRYETSIDTERMYMVTYQTSVIITEAENEQ